MLLKFFLCFQEPDNKNYSNSLTAVPSSYASRGRAWRSNQNEITLSGLMNSLSIVCSTRNYEIYSRVIPLTLTGEVLFQLQMCGVMDGVYCGYNIYTDEVYFGNCADDASGLDLGYAPFAATGRASSNDVFDYSVEVPEVQKPYVEPVPDELRYMVREQISDVIDFEKSHILHEFGKYIMFSEDNIAMYIDALGTQNENSISTRSVLSSIECTYAMNCFMNDSVQMMELKSTNPYMYNKYSELFFKIMTKTNETI